MRAGACAAPRRAAAGRADAARASALGVHEVRQRAVGPRDPDVGEELRAKHAPVDDEKNVEQTIGIALPVVGARGG